MFDGEEVKLFQALNEKYGEEPVFDVASIRYDFSHHKQYHWRSDEVCE